MLHYVKKTSSSRETVYSACWANDGLSIYPQDMQYFYRLGLDGVELTKWPLSTLLPNFSLTSATYIAPSPDSHTLLLDAESETEPVTAADWDGLTISLWSIDLTSEKANV